MGLFEDLKKPGVFLGVDQVDVCIEVVLLEGFDPVSLFFVPRQLLLLLLGLKTIFDDLSLLPDLVSFLLVKLGEFLCMVENFIEEFSVSCLLPQLLPRPHLLFEPI